MLNDKEFLQWIGDRMVHVHGDHPEMPHMALLSEIIAATPAERSTPNIASFAAADTMNEELRVIYDRMLHVHRENEYVDYMHQLRAIGRALRAEHIAH